jgi:hypothetical protein
LTIEWERDTVPGVYWREGTRGRKLFRHVYRNTENKQVACSSHPNITSARKHQREMLVTKPQPITRATLRQSYEQLVADAGHADATLEVHRAAWKHIQHLADIPADAQAQQAATDQGSVATSSATATT